MKITTIKTDPIGPSAPNLEELVDRYIPTITNRSIVAITSKVVSICENRIVKIGSVDKRQLVRDEADYYLPPELNPYNFSVTVKSDILIASAGIDESNGNGYYVLWPKNPQASANALRQYLSVKHHCSLGVIITDSRITPLRRGTIGIGLAHSGFAALKNYIDKPDIFGHKLLYTYANILDGLAAASVMMMGEGDECTPLALIEDVDKVDFQDRSPTIKELHPLRVPLEEDVYSEMLKTIPWQKYPGHP